MKKTLFFLLLLLAIFPLVSACGLDEEHGPDSIINFGFTGGFISALVIIAVVLSIILINKKNSLKGGRK